MPADTISSSQLIRKQVIDLSILWEQSLLPLDLNAEGEAASYGADFTQGSHSKWKVTLRCACFGRLGIERNHNTKLCFNQLSSGKNYHGRCVVLHQPESMRHL